MTLPPSIWPSRLMEQNFGMCITPDDFVLPFYNTYNYYRPWKWNMPNVLNDVGSTIKNETESFKVTLDVQHFRPNELSVKVANNKIIIEGKHEQRKDEHGFVSRQFTRRYALPNNCMPEDVISNLSSDGILTVIANKKPKQLTDERSVPVKLCQSCPLKKKAVKTSSDQKDKSTEVITDDANKKNKQIMLKEDHCCLLLKPELLRAAASDSSELTVEKSKEKVEDEKLKVRQAGKNTYEMLEQTFAKSSATTSSSGGKCDKTATSKTKELAEQKIATGESLATLIESSDKCGKTTLAKTEEIAEQKIAGTIALSARSEKTTTSKIEEIAQQKMVGSIATSAASSDRTDMCEQTTTSKTEEVTEQNIAESIATVSSASETCGITATSKSEVAEQNITKSSAIMSESQEKFDLFDEATASMSTSLLLEQAIEKSNVGMCSLSEIVGQSSMSKSEMSEVTSMSSKTSESIECAASSSMASNIIKEMNEELSDFVTEMLCFEEELEKSLDMNK